MKRNLVLLSVVLSFVLVFSYSCKHSSSQTSATPLDYGLDCARLVKLTDGIGYLNSKVHEALFYDMERVIQFTNTQTEAVDDEDLIFDSRGIQVGNRVFVAYANDNSSLDPQVLSDIKQECKILEEEKPSKYGIVAVIARGNNDRKTGMTTCSYDIFDCDEQRISRTYSTDQVIFTFKEFIKDECLNGISLQNKVYKANNREWLVLNFSKPFENCYQKPLYINSKALSIPTKSVAIRINEHYPEPGKKLFINSKNVNEVLNYKFSGMIETMPYDK